MRNNLFHTQAITRYSALIPCRIRLILIFLAASMACFSQVNSFADQYLANLFLLNPALAGTGRFATLAVNSRQQWVGWDGAPASQSVTYHTKFAKSRNRFTPQGFVNKGKNTYSNVGIGGGFFHDSYGVFHLTGVHLDYSYHVLVNNGRLSLGLSPSLFRIGASSIVLADPNDPYLNNSAKRSFFDFNAGVHYLSQKGYAGFSLVQLLNSKVNFGSEGFLGTGESLNPDLARSVYAYGGYFFDLNRDINLKIEPMALIKLHGIEGFRVDLSTTMHLRDTFTAGLSYRLNKGVSVFTGVRLDNVSLRYQFEIPVTTDLPGGFSTHMIQLGINIGQPID